MPRVFISYAHESEAHRARVLALAQALRHRGIDAWIDRFEARVPEGWPRWMRRQIVAADRVLLVCTGTYVARFEGPVDASRGVTWEGFFLEQLLYDAGARNDKIVCGRYEPGPVPNVLALYQTVDLFDVAAVARVLSGQAEVDAVPLGAPAASAGMGAAPDTASRLDLAYERKRTARRDGLDIAAIDREIVALERDLRGARTVGPGAMLGPYRLVALVGDGGFATVWRAWEALEFGEEREVALKVLHEKWHEAPTYVEQFRKGASNMAALASPHVVPVLRPPGPKEQFYAMELMPGGSLRDAVVSRRLGPREAMEVALGAAEGLIGAHRRKLVHGDVKPHNILLDGAGCGRLTDFDLVRVMDAQTAQKTRAAGTLCYLAPEIESPPHKGDARADVYGLGLVLAFCALGRDLVVRDVGNPAKLIARLEVPEALRAVLTRALEERPEDRYATVGELAGAVRGAWAAVVEVPQAASAPTAAGRWPTRETADPRQGVVVIHPGDPEPGARRVLDLGGAPMEVVWIPAGEYWRGATSEEGAINFDPEATGAMGPVARVTITRGFWMGRHPVTNAVYRRFVVANRHREAESAGQAGFQEDGQPVTGVDWLDASTFATWAGAAAGLQGGLPTEHEWEWAARGWDGRRFPWGDERPTAARALWVGAKGAPDKWWSDLTNEEKRLAPSGPAEVGRHAEGASPFGVEDASGNVWEWCRDVWVERRPGDKQLDPCQGGDTPVASEAPRVVRGGSWRYPSRSLRCAGRGKLLPLSRGGVLGFRVVFHPSGSFLEFGS